MLCSEIKASKALELNCHKLSACFVPGVIDTKMIKTAIFPLDVSWARAISNYSVERKRSMDSSVENYPPLPFWLK